MCKKYTLSLAQLMCLVAGTITLVILSVAGTVYSTASRMMDERIRQIGYSAVTTSGQLIDQTLLSVDQFVFDFMYDNSSLTELNESFDTLTLYRAKNDISEELERMGRLYTVNGMMIYSPDGAEAEKILCSSNPRLLKQNMWIADKLVASVNAEQNENPLPYSEWFLQTYNSKQYLVRMILLHETYCAIWIDESSLIGRFASSENDVQGDYFFSHLSQSEETNIVPETDDKKLLQYPSRSGSFLLCLNPIFSNKNAGIYSTIPAVIAALVLLIPLLVVCGYRLLYLPFKRFNHTMLSINNGRIYARANGPVHIREFGEMYDIFNQLMDDIQSLKLNIYENQLDKQRVEQQFLHIQIRNHFFLNCLNIIYSLAQVEDYKLIQQMTMYLVSYFRHISKNAMEGVSLEDEVAHVRDYISIQQIRFPSRIEFHCHMDALLSDFRVPSLILLTFIENCIIHALSPNCPITTIVLELQQIPLFETTGLYARIYDNGQGFSEEQLEELNSTDISLNLGEIHGIGIHNIRKRLQLLYGCKAQMNFSNNKSGGALIELRLPPWKEHIER